ncbi:hypothetical protein FYJ85_12900 [Victivallaceae bacterium BBE-744-WT-12]|uniref:Uncharacterized protein n=1 Tax=Victivallis lenta TaxID=2606640 RepID=A0A844G2N3_9BACT|nr:hypothetical protein [Victivallis lenta]MST97937.1 hypothetical protein [Victivallis lenta]
MKRVFLLLLLALGFSAAGAEPLERNGRWPSPTLMKRHGAQEDPFVYLQKIGVRKRPAKLVYAGSMLHYWDTAENVDKIQKKIEDRLRSLSKSLADSDFSGFKKELEAGSPSTGLYYGPGRRGRNGRS